MQNLDFVISVHMYVKYMCVNKMCPTKAGNQYLLGKECFLLFPHYKVKMSGDCHLVFLSKKKLNNMINKNGIIFFIVEK